MTWRDSWWHQVEPLKTADDDKAPRSHLAVAPVPNGVRYLVTSRGLIGGRCNELRRFKYREHFLKIILKF